MNHLEVEGLEPSWRYPLFQDFGLLQKLHQLAFTLTKFATLRMC